jgi:hypothetical protein
MLREECRIPRAWSSPFSPPSGSRIFFRLSIVGRGRYRGIAAVSSLYCLLDSLSKLCCSAPHPLRNSLAHARVPIVCGVAHHKRRCQGVPQGGWIAFVPLDELCGKQSLEARMAPSRAWLDARPRNALWRLGFAQPR